MGGGGTGAVVILFLYKYVRYKGWYIGVAWGVYLLFCNHNPPRAKLLY